MDRIYLSPPHMGEQERQLLLEAFDSNWIAPVGPHIEALEREMAASVGCEHAVAVNTGTAALHLALHVLGVAPGDEVLVSTLTFCASANVVRYLGATPVFIDSEAASWNMDPALLADELRACAERGRLPRAVVAVDLYGQCADWDPIHEVCKRYDVPVVEDAAEAVGATYKGRCAGSLGDIGAISFNGNKIITASAGGVLVSDREDWVGCARLLATQAREPVPHYEHLQVGYNYRMSNLLAAIARGQLRVLPQRVEQRRANNAYYRAALGDLPGITLAPEAPHGRSTFWLTCITVNADAFGASTADLMVALERANIESRPIWKPMHLQPVFAGCRARTTGVSERLFHTGLCLPSGSALDDAHRQRVVEVIRAGGRRKR